MAFEFFRNRQQAGRVLAHRLAAYAHKPDVVVLALPRGGTPVACEVAKALHAPLDVLVVRKLGVPGHEELAMGAIASGGVRVLNPTVIDAIGISDVAINAVAEREFQELKRRERTYRDHRPLPEMRGRTIILVDDGIATGSTMRAAIEALRKLEAAHIVVATPTIAQSTADEMERDVDELIAVMRPTDFAGVGQWYENFSQTSDGEVRRLLQKASEVSSDDR